jgi:hypothetical protein
MSLNFEEVNILGNLMNDTYGKSSTTSSYPSRLGKYDDSTVSTKASLQGDQLCVTSLCIKNLGPHGQQHQVIHDTTNELDQRIKKYMTTLEKDFKKKENAGRKLKKKEDKNKRSTDVQMINHYAETRQAYIFRRAYFEVS